VTSDIKNEIIEGGFTKLEPDFNRECDNCGATPTVTIVDTTSQSRDHTYICGACFFGEAAMLDSENW